MKSTGIVRKVDDLGRIVIPKEIRQTMRMGNGTPLEILVEGDTVILSRYRLQCVCCGNKEEKGLRVVDGVHMCGECIRKFNMQMTAKHAKNGGMKNDNK